MNTHHEMIQKAFRVSAENAAALASSQTVTEQLAQAAQMICDAYKNGGCLFVAGNGGSAADAQHLVAELVSKLSKDRTPIRAFAMTVDTSILTAIGNDYGYDKSFSRQVLGLMKPNDIFLAITTSGNSQNILAALKACKDVGAKSVLLSGKEGGSAKALADHSIIAPGVDTGRIQESHLTIYHTLCGLIEHDLVQAGLCHYV